MNTDSDKNISISPVPKFVDNALTKLTDKPLEQAGNSLADIWFLVFGGIGQAANKRRTKYAADLKKFQKELEEKIEEIPNEKRTEANLQVVGPALEASKYCVDKAELRRLFVNLIASSMNVDKKAKVHPYFVNLIEQMSPSEAFLLTLLTGRNERDNKLYFEEFFDAYYDSIEKLAMSFAMLIQFGLVIHVDIPNHDQQAEISIHRINGAISGSNHILVMNYDFIFALFDEYFRYYKKIRFDDLLALVKKYFFITKLGELFVMLCID